MSQVRSDRIENSEEILQLLESPLSTVSQPRNLALAYRLEERRQIQDLGQLNTQLLHQLRLRSSNTIHDSKALSHWARTNQWMLEHFTGTGDITLDFIREINGRLSGLDEPAECRRQACYTANQEYLAWEEVEPALDRLLMRIGSCHNALESAFLLTEGLLTIHPFADANGRTSRLMGDFVLLKAGYLPQVYLSPIVSHMALTINGPRRNRSHSYEKFLKGVTRTYDLCLPQSEARRSFCE